MNRTSVTEPGTKVTGICARISKRPESEIRNTILAVILSTLPRGGALQQGMNVPEAPQMLRAPSIRVLCEWVGHLEPKPFLLIGRQSVRAAAH
jgi:hypothetical protein